jgi:hypothetical protein
VACTFRSSAASSCDFSPIGERSVRAPWRIFAIRAATIALDFRHRLRRINYDGLESRCGFRVRLRCGRSRNFVLHFLLLDRFGCGISRTLVNANCTLIHPDHIGDRAVAQALQPLSSSHPGRNAGLHQPPLPPAARAPPWPARYCYVYGKRACGSRQAHLGWEALLLPSASHFAAQRRIRARHLTPRHEYINFFLAHLKIPFRHFARINLTQDLYFWMGKVINSAPNIA